MSTSTNRVRLYRERRKWTLRKLAALADTTESHLSRIERGLVKPFGITEQAISDALGIDRDELFPQPQEASA